MASPRQVRIEVTATGTTTWTAPAGVRHIFAQGIGGGAGGGKGAGGSASTVLKPSGGGGGGSSTESVVPLDVTPGASYDLIVGAGGLGGTAPAEHGEGGEDTRIQPTAGGSEDTELICWPGAAPGLAGADATFNYGGIAVRDGDDVDTAYNGTANGFFPQQGRGGYSSYETGPAAKEGAQGQNGLGGSNGSPGAPGGAFHAGGGGGGGAGGGPAGANGGAGGTGGNGNNAGVGLVGAPGSNGQGPGAGGGGGGGGGCGSSGGAVGGNGGNGADGRIVLFWWE